MQITDHSRSTGIALFGKREAEDPQQAAPNGEAYHIKFSASTENLASDGGVIRSSAWDWKRYLSNPLFIAGHDIFGWDQGLTGTVVGTVVCLEVRDDLPKDIAFNGRGLVVYVRFMPTTFGEEMRLLYMNGGINQVSVRWDSNTMVHRLPTAQERKQYAKQIEETGFSFDWVATRVSLIEISAVLLGADSGALALRSRLLRKRHDHDPVGALAKDLSDAQELIQSWLNTGTELLSHVTGLEASLESLQIASEAGQKDEPGRLDIAALLGGGRVDLDAIFNTGEGR